MPSPFSFLLFSLPVAANSSPPGSVAASEPAPAYQIERSTLATGHGTKFYTQSRGAIVPGERPRVIVTTQLTDPTGAHGYSDLYTMETADDGRTWSEPKLIESLR